MTDKDHKDVSNAVASGILKAVGVLVAIAFLVFLCWCYAQWFIYR